MRPQLLAGLGVKGIDLAPGGGGVKHPIDDNWGGFLPTIGVKFGAPRKAERADCIGIDLVEPGIALLFIGATMGQPVAGFAASGCQPRVINLARRAVAGLVAGGKRDKRSCQKDAVSNHGVIAPLNPMAMRQLAGLCSPL